MNIALTAAVIFVLTGPGFLAIYLYQRFNFGLFPKLEFQAQVITALLVACVVHFATTSAVVKFSDFEPDARIIISLLTSMNSDDGAASVQEVSTNIAAYWNQIGGYFLLAYAGGAAFAAIAVIASMVFLTEGDRWESWLRDGRKNVWSVVDVHTKSGLLFTGIFHSRYPMRNPECLNLVLAQRWTGTTLPMGCAPPGQLGQEPNGGSFTDIRSFVQLQDLMQFFYPEVVERWGNNVEIANEFMQAYVEDPDFFANDLHGTLTRLMNGAPDLSISMSDVLNLNIRRFEFIEGQPDAAGERTYQLVAQAIKDLGLEELAATMAEIQSETESPAESTTSVADSGTDSQPEDHLLEKKEEG